MQRFKKVAALFLSVICLLHIIPAEIDAAFSMTESEFADKIALLQEKYPDGLYWSCNNGTRTDGVTSGTALVGGYSCGSHSWSSACGKFTFNGVNLGYQCHGYALMLAYELFGLNANTWTAYYDRNRQIYAGDLVRIDSNGDGLSGDYDHTIYVYRVTDTHIYYTDCNQSGPCKINWSEGEMSLTELRSKFLYLRHLDGNTLTGSGTDAPVLNVFYDLAGGSMTGGKSYILTTDGYGLRLRASASLSSNVLVGMPDGIEISVEETTEAEGYIWGNVTYNGYTGWCALSNATEVYAVKRYYDLGGVIYDYVTGGEYTDSGTFGSPIGRPLIDAEGLGIAREGYTFLGWSSAPGGSAEIFGSGSMPYSEQLCPELESGDKNITVYAVWEPILTNHTVSYDGNGGTGKMDSHEVSEGELFVVPGSSFTFAGHVFRGWNLKRSDGLWQTSEGVWASFGSFEKKIFLPDEVYIINDAWTSGLDSEGEFTFYAVWGEAAVTEVSIQTPPDKVLYKVGETFDPAGMTLLITYEDGTTKTVESGYDLVYDFSTSGEKTVEVIYGNYSVKQDVTVEAQFVLICDHKNTEVRGYIAATCNTPGYTGDTFCLYCGVKTVVGADIEETGAHIDADGEWSTDDLTHAHVCSCGEAFDIGEHEYSGVSVLACSVCERERSAEELECNVYNLGGAIRPKSETLSAGLRFGSYVNKSEYGIEGEYAYDGAEATFGILIIPKYVIESQGYESLKEYYLGCENESTRDIVAKKIYYQNDSVIQYTAVLVGIPESDYGTVICALPYVDIGERRSFGTEMRTSYYDVAILARTSTYSDEAIAAIEDDAKRESAQNIAISLDEIISIVESDKN